MEKLIRERQSRILRGGELHGSLLTTAFLVVALFIATGSTGCGGAVSGQDEERAGAALRMVGIEYGRYMSSNAGAVPPDEAALRTFLQGQITRTPNYGVASVDELLTTTRDGQPLILICGRKVAPPDQPDAPWAAHEQVGLGGKRLVVNARGAVVEMDAEQFKQLATAR